MDVWGNEHVMQCVSLACDLYAYLGSRKGLLRCQGDVEELVLRAS